MLNPINLPLFSLLLITIFLMVIVYDLVKSIRKGCKVSIEVDIVFIIFFISLMLISASLMLIY